MKFLETNFVDYTNKCEKNNLHKDICFNKSLSKSPGPFHKVTIKIGS